MRKMVIAFLALGVFAASAAFAGNLVNEGFTYINGNLVPNNPGAPALGPWANYSGAGDILIASNYATGIMNTAARAADDALPFTAQTALVPTYACFDAFIPCFGATAPLPSYFAGLKDAGTSNLLARVYVVALGTTGGWTFAVSHYSTSATVGVRPWSATSLACDTWYRIVIKYDPVVKSSTMWVNPVNEFSASVMDSNSAAPATAVSTFFLRQGAASTIPPGNAGTTSWNWRTDNLGVGTSFAEACYVPPPPTTGACCLRTTPGACVVVTPAECNLQNGVFLGLGVPCVGIDCQVVPATKTSWGQLKTIYR